MKRIDLHIHTVKTVCDPQNYCFDLEVLKRYVETAQLDAIAVTNHNLFDRANYDSICNAIDIPVFPGIEVNVRTPGKYGHVLVIAPSDDVDIFELDAEKMTMQLPDKDSRAPWDLVESTFSNISKYLVIPHYRKDKQLDLKTIDEIRKSTGIDALEVANAKKWLKEKVLVNEPLVLFSDCRPGLRMDSTDKGEADPHRYAYGFTYVKCEELTVPALKKAFATGRNTAVFRDDDIFEILPEALPVSTGLNVVIGNRTSGKTYTLNRIADAFEPNDIAYIKQFDITKKAEEKKFNEIVAAEDAKYEDGYLKPLKSGLSDYFDLDIEGLKEKVRNYAEAVITFANSPEDDASRVPIYRAQAFAFDSDDKRTEEDVKLRNAARKLARENTRSEIIANYINKESLVALDKALRMEMLEAVKLRVAKECANTIIAASKSRLTELSSRKPLPPSKPISDYFRATFYEDGLSKLLGELESPVDLESEDAGRFTKKRRRTKVQSASEGKKRVSTQFGISGLYKTPDMLSKLRFLRSFPDELKLSAHKLLVKVDTFIVDKKRNTPLSGGQRAEYVFIHELDKARNKDIVLIDEPESSFDNRFLKSDISSALHRLSSEATVFLVTHNNTLGVSINPDWLIYAVYDDGKYELFSGAMSSKTLKSSDGNIVERRDILMETMEAGWDAYEGRRIHYDLTQD